MNYGFTLKQYLNWGCVWNAVTIAPSAVWLSSQFHKVIITIVLLVIDIQADNDFQSTNDVHFLQHKYINYLLSHSIYTRPSTLPLPLSQGGTHCRWIWHRWFVGWGGGCLFTGSVCTVWLGADRRKPQGSGETQTPILRRLMPDVSDWLGGVAKYPNVGWLYLSGLHLGDIAMV